MKIPICNSEHVNDKEVQPALSCGYVRAGNNDVIFRIV